MKSAISIPSIISGLVLFFAAGLYGQFTENTEEVFGKEERVTKPVEKEQGLMNIMNGTSVNRKGTTSGEPPADDPPEGVREDMSLEAPVEEENGLHYLDEEQDE